MLKTAATESDPKNQKNVGSDPKTKNGGSDYKNKKNEGPDPKIKQK